MFHLFPGANYTFFEQSMEMRLFSFWIVMFKYHGTILLGIRYTQFLLGGSELVCSLHVGWKLACAGYALMCLWLSLKS
jgi:hypothetical protein